MRNHQFYILFLCLLFTSITYAQEPRAETRFEVIDLDCTTNELLLDVQVRAAPGSPSFDFLKANLRWTYPLNGSVDPMPNIFSGNLNPNSAPIWIKDFTLFSNSGSSGSSGIWIDNCGQTSIIDPHTLRSSDSNLVSYNIDISGNGVCLQPGEWNSIGTIRVTLSDPSICFKFNWNGANDFPSTKIFRVNSNPFDPSPVPVNVVEQFDFSYCSDSACPTLPAPQTFIGSSNLCLNYLKWMTETETNTSHFILQKTSLLGNTTTIGIIPAAGNSDDPVQYKFKDLVDGPKNFYELILVDIFGNQTFFADLLLVSPYCGMLGRVNVITQIYPNPLKSSQSLNIEFFNSKNEGEADLVISNILGEIIELRSIDVLVGENYLEYKSEKLNSGTYFIQIKGKDWYSKAMKFVKL